MPGNLSAQSLHPHWIALDFDRNVKPAPRLVSVHGRRLATYRDASMAVRVVDDVCPHRGASLASGGTVVGNCIRCMYHNRPVEGKELVRVQDGIAWLGWDFARENGVLLDLAPPTIPEFWDPAMKTFEYSKSLPVNPVLLTENTIDWAHLHADVHRVKFIDGLPRVDILATGSHGLATYTYDTTTPLDLVIENEYWTPFTTGLRFLFTSKKTGALYKLALWFTLRPGGPGEETTLLLRVSRSFGHFLPDALFKAIDCLPLLEDAYVVSSMYPGSWAQNKLTADDAFVSAYRTVMAERLHSLLDMYVLNT